MQAEPERAAVVARLQPEDPLQFVQTCRTVLPYHGVSQPGFIDLQKEECDIPAVDAADPKLQKRPGVLHGSSCRILRCIIRKLLLMVCKMALFMTAQE